MRPLPGSRTAPEEVIFNYRLSRARRCVENAFGIFVSRWGIYERQVNMEPENAAIIVKATCVLPNFLSSNAASTYCPPGYMDFQDMFGTNEVPYLETLTNTHLLFQSPPEAVKCAIQNGVHYRGAQTLEPREGLVTRPIRKTAPRRRGPCSMRGMNHEIWKGHT
ncbi:hypothetical protein HPB49_012241 [Dermacentor silvarum]|uniref:Uncharacterized protein n=1 Tax=Dermacentor silvarum TaxID=543639 RepID=A0ACB8DNW0_DERSI|nr:hypothetical protein HPB49_012241 [Dermacentor silvarum]